LYLLILKQKRSLEQGHQELKGLNQLGKQVGASHLVFSICVNSLINFRIYYFIASINIEMNMSTLHTLMCIN